MPPVMGKRALALLTSKRRVAPTSSHAMLGQQFHAGRAQQQETATHGTGATTLVYHTRSTANKSGMHCTSSRMAIAGNSFRQTFISSEIFRWYLAAIIPHNGTFAMQAAASQEAAACGMMMLLGALVRDDFGRSRLGAEPRVNDAIVALTEQINSAA